MKNYEYTNMKNYDAFKILNFRRKLPSLKIQIANMFRYSSMDQDKNISLIVHGIIVESFDKLEA